MAGSGFRILSLRSGARTWSVRKACGKIFAFELGRDTALDCCLFENDFQKSNPIPFSLLAQTLNVFVLSSLHGQLAERLGKDHGYTVRVLGLSIWYYSSD